MKTQNFSSDEEIKQLVAAFEQATLPVADFNHAAHIAVAMAYLDMFPEHEAVSHMRKSIQHFLSHHSQTGYHETLTLFWMKLLGHLTSIHSHLPLCQRINQVIEMYGTTSPITLHYSKESRESLQARTNWLEPDLAPLPKF